MINLDSNTVVRLQLWDIAGQERFGNMTRVYYKEAVGAFIVFDVTRASTFEAVHKWKHDIDSKVQPHSARLPVAFFRSNCCAYSGSPPQRRQRSRGSLGQQGSSSLICLAVMAQLTGGLGTVRPDQGGVGQEQ